MIKLEVDKESGLLEVWEFSPTPMPSDYDFGMYMRQGLVCEGHGLEIGKLLKDVSMSDFEVVAYVPTAFNKVDINMRTLVYKYKNGVD